MPDLLSLQQIDVIFLRHRGARGALVRTAGCSRKYVARLLAGATYNAGIHQAADEICRQYLELERLEREWRIRS